MRPVIVHPGGSILRKELVYQLTQGEMPPCPVCGNAVGTKEGCMKCEYTYRRMLDNTMYKEVRVSSRE